MKNRNLSWLLVAFALIIGSISGGAAHAADKVVRIAHQKLSTLALLRSTGKLEEKLKALGYKVTWTEFPAGPQLLEGLNVGAVDFGHTGEAPPVFAQAAGAPLFYVGNEPSSPTSEAILVPTKSSIKSVSDLKGSVWPSTKVPTSITSWFERWRRRVFQIATSLRSFFRRPMRARLLSQARSMLG